MISVIIPLMPIEPYSTQVDECIKTVNGQTDVDVEIIVSRQEQEAWIKKNRLFNKGIEKAQGDIIFFCDADFILNDSSLFKRMAQKMYDDILDVIYPMFISKVFEDYKIADGAAFVKRETIERYGKFPEKDIGISKISFPFLQWCMNNTRFYCGREFLIELNDKPFTLRHNKVHQETWKRLKPCFQQTVAKLKRQHLWPQ